MEHRKSLSGTFPVTQPREESQYNFSSAPVGASSGIGFGAALRFAREGARLAITGRNQDALQKLISECKKNGSRDDSILPIVGDIGDDKFRESLIAATVEKFQRIDVLVNNAGE